jgi:restriction system protein
MIHDVACGNCGLPIENELPNGDSSARGPCPRCGSTSRRFDVHLSGELRLASNLSVTPQLAQLRFTGHAPIVEIAASDTLRVDVAENVAVKHVAGAHIESTAELFPGTVSQDLPDLVLQAAVVNLGDRTTEGHLISGIAIPWIEIIRHLQRDPAFLYQIPWRRLEEVIAGAYEREGWPEVILTPPSGDGGRDVIASKPGVGSIRILDQVKAYRPGRVVDANDVRAMLGVLEAEQNVSKGLVTTTSAFAPGIESDQRLARFMPYRLELKNGKQLLSWLTSLLGQS